MNTACVARVLLSGLLLQAVCADRVGAQATPASQPPDSRLESMAADIAALKAENERLRTLIPGQSHAMVDVAYQFTNLWFAGQAENWPLAQFYFNETRSRIKWTIRLSPTRKTKAGGEIKLQEIFDPVDASLFSEIQKQITAQDRKQFGAAYQAALVGCNGCHIASEKPYLNIVVPIQPENRIVEFKPRPASK